MPKVIGKPMPSDRVKLYRTPIEEIRFLDMGLNKDAIGFGKSTYRTREMKQKVKAAKRRIEKRRDRAE